MTRLFAFWLSHRAELASLLGQHVLDGRGRRRPPPWRSACRSACSPRNVPRLASPMMAVASIVQTIPSLASVGFLLPVPLVGGVGARAALVLLILYGLLPIVRTTIAGLRGIDASIREAGVAMGMTPRELLRQVELPLASAVDRRRRARCRGPSASALRRSPRRSARAASASTSTRGLSMVDTTVILAGAVPAAALALVVDASLLWLERQVVGAPPIRLPACGRDDGCGRRRRGAPVERRCGATGERRRHRRRVEELH